MAIPIIVPRRGWSMDEGTFVQWLKNPGDAIQPGDPLFEFESDKATDVIAAIDAGILHIPADAPKPGGVVRVGQVLGYLMAAGETMTEIVNEAPSPKPQDKSPVSRDASLRAERTARVLTISPRARRVAAELGIDWRTVQGSGSTGRVRERDVRDAMPGSDGRLVPHSQLRRVIAARTLAALTQAAPVTLTTKADATRLVEWRRLFQVSSVRTPSYTACLVKLAAAVLYRHPLLQAQWRDDGLFYPSETHIAVAVDRTAGLVAPVIRNADRLTLQQISEVLDGFVEQARAGTLPVEALRGGTFTITNLGMYGVDAFTPIIQLPQSAVLGIGRIVREPAVVDDQIVPRHMITLSLTFDHRVMDGAPAAKFLDTLRRLIEQPAEALS